MNSTLVFVHVGAGLLALLGGAGALVFRKGSQRHRVTGSAFFVSMMIMAGVAAYLAVFYKPNAINSTMGVFTCYLVSTAWMAVKRRPGPTGRFEIFAMPVAFAVAAFAAHFGLEAAASATGMKDKMPAGLYFAVAGVAALHALSDLRLVWRGELSGPRRLARHLSRMGFAFFIAAGSFFLGQPMVWSAALRKSGLLFVPVLAIIVVTLYWLWRVRRSPARKKRSTGAPWTTPEPSPERV